MLKRIRPATMPAAGENWRDLNEDVEVELTSEDPDWPIEHALLPQQDTTGLPTYPGQPRETPQDTPRDTTANPY